MAMVKVTETPSDSKATVKKEEGLITVLPLLKKMIKKHASRDSKT